MNSRRLGFAQRRSVQGRMPEIYPVDLVTGEEIHGCRRCEVVSEIEGVTVMTIELILFDPESKVKPL